MQSLREMLEAAARYTAEQAALNLAEEKTKVVRTKIYRKSAAELRERRERRAALNPELCSRCQKNPKYKTKNGVAYGSICYDCMKKKKAAKLLASSNQDIDSPSKGTNTKPVKKPNNLHREAATC